MKKALVVGILALIAGVLLAYLYFTPSYQKALQAQESLSRGEYEKAERLAQESLALDAYNRRAMSLLQESRLGREWQGFLDEARARQGEILRLLQGRMTLELKRRLEWLASMTIGQFEARASALPLSPKQRQERENLEAWYRQLAQELGALEEATLSKSALR